MSIIRESVRAEVEPEPTPPVPDPIQRRVMFEVASAELSEPARATLDDLLAVDGMSGGQWRIRLTGRTDSSGDAEANLRLSQRRAEAVRDHLAEGGAPAERMTITAAGESVPEPGRETASARRVDVRAEPVASSADAE